MLRRLFKKKKEKDKRRPSMPGGPVDESCEIDVDNVCIDSLLDENKKAMKDLVGEINQMPERLNTKK